METKIVTAIDRLDEAGEAIPCLENLAKPGMTAIFLLRFPLQFWPYLRDHWVTTESVRTAAERGRENLAKYSRKAQQELADQKLAPLRTALGNKGVVVKIEFYTGSLQATLIKYCGDPQVIWIVLPISRGGLFTQLRAMIVAHFRSLCSTKLVHSWSLFRVAYRRETDQ
jgi:hypothetical protein